MPVGAMPATRCLLAIVESTTGWQPVVKGDGLLQSVIERVR